MRVCLLLLQQLDSVPHRALEASQLLLELAQDTQCVCISLLPDALGLGFRIVQDLLTLGLGTLEQLVFADEAIGLFLGQRQDMFGALLGLTDDLVAFLLNLSGSLDVLRYRDPELVNQPQELILVDQRFGRKGDAGTLTEQSLQAIY